MRNILKELYLDLNFKLFPRQRLVKSGAKIGRNVFFGKCVYVELENAKLLTIEDGAVLSAFTKIILHDSSLNNVLCGKMLYGKVVLKKNCYIGVNTTVLPGTVVGTNTIVGANSLVKGRLKSNSVYFGSPAKYYCSVKMLSSRWSKRRSSLIKLKKFKRWKEIN